MKPWSIISIVVAIIVAALIISASFFLTQSMKQESIENQKQMEIAAEERARLVQEEQDRKEYIVKRKKDCYELENSEREKWDNVVDSRYDEDDDQCFIKYKDTNGNSWGNVNCEEIETFRLQVLCENKEFEKIF